MATLHDRWGGPADGPYVHIDEVLEYLRSNVETFKAKESLSGTVAANYFDQIHTIFGKWAADVRKRRLEKLAATAPAALQDLIDLHDELAGDLDP